MAGWRSACKRPVELNDEVLRELQLEKTDAKKHTFYEGAGCVECNNSGYRGRQGVYEVLSITPQIRDLVLDRASAGEIKKLAIEQGMLGEMFSLIFGTMAIAFAGLGVAGAIVLVVLWRRSKAVAPKSPQG